VTIATPDGHYCIDATEVTNDDYAEWLSTNPSANVDQAACSWKTSHVPDSWPKRFDEGALPVTFVDWCDAYAYCAWTGKRLCGAIGGGAHGYGDPNNPETDMWFRACSGGDARDYPYEGPFDATACVGAGYAEPALTAPIAVKQAARCVGGVAGLFDMAGNVNEWEDSCEGTTGEDDNCRWRGGCYDATGPDPSCMTNQGTPGRGTRSLRVGFRCCHD
jgi:formylglycine-generating enzyme required for sulfatase activity